MNSLPTPQVAAGPLTLCGVEWASPQALIATAPDPLNGETYASYFTRLEEWALPYLQEASKIGWSFLKDDQPHTIPWDHFVYALTLHLNRWRPLQFNVIGAPVKRRWNESKLIVNGEINVAFAIDLITDAFRHQQLPPPPVLRWLMSAFYEMPRGIGHAKSLDEILGIVKKSGAKKTVFQSEKKKEDNFIYASLMALLTDNGLSTFRAAELIRAQEECITAKFFIELNAQLEPAADPSLKKLYDEVGSCNGEKLMELVTRVRINTDLMTRTFRETLRNSQEHLSADRIEENWTKIWRREFRAELNFDYYDNPVYIKKRDSGELRFVSMESAWTNQEKNFERETQLRIEGLDAPPTFYGDGMDFPHECLITAKSQGLKIKF